jgi:regulator of protease activity HflC (stomatin/prohibitin superfamily)
MRVESIMVVHLPGSLVSAAVTIEALTNIIREGFERTDPQYEAIHVHTTDGPLIFRRNEATTITKDQVSAKISSAVFYRTRDQAQKLGRVRGGW